MQVSGYGCLWRLAQAVHGYIYAQPQSAGTLAISDVRDYRAWCITEGYSPHRHTQTAWLYIFSTCLVCSTCLSPSPIVGLRYPPTFRYPSFFNGSLWTRIDPPRQCSLHQNWSFLEELIMFITHLFTVRRKVRSINSVVMKLSECWANQEIIM